MRKSNLRTSVNEASSRIMLEELLRRKIKVEHLNPYHKGNAFLALTFGKHREFICGTKSSLTSSDADYVCKNKMLTKAFLKKARLAFAAGEMFPCCDRSGIERFVAEVGVPFVMKKYDGSRGKLVFPQVRSFSEGREILDKYFHDEKYVLIERRFEGTEYRFFATREKVLGVILRDPAHVIGDGHSSIARLIENKNEGRIHASKIKPDKVVKTFLKDRGLSLQTVAAAGETVYLRGNSNVSTGGDSTDLTDQAHPELKAIAINAIRSIPGLAYGGVDIMLSSDISCKPRRKDYVILEINADPGISIHHFPCSGQPRNVAGGIVDLLFPETQRSDVPVGS